jgi:hypothetical protein
MGLCILCEKMYLMHMGLCILCDKIYLVHMGLWILCENLYFVHMGLCIYVRKSILSILCNVLLLSLVGFALRRTSTMDLHPILYVLEYMSTWNDTYFHVNVAMDLLCTHEMFHGLAMHSCMFYGLAMLSYLCCAIYYVLYASKLMTFDVIWGYLIPYMDLFDATCVIWRYLICYANIYMPNDLNCRD